MTDKSKRLSGLSNSYYDIDVPLPDNKVVTVSCNDIIDTLDMNFNEGTAFKALWRKAALRQGRGKPGSDPLYEAEKVFWSGRREVLRNGGKV